MSSLQLPAPSYAIQRDVLFNDNLVPCVLLGPAAGSPAPEILVVWDDLPRGDQDAVLELIREYGGHPIGAEGGFQKVLVQIQAAGSPVAFATGLNNDSTEYQIAATYVAGSPPVAIDSVGVIVGSDAQTLTDLATEITSNLGDSSIVATVEGGNLKIENTRTGTGKDVIINPTISNLFLGLDGYTGLSEVRVGVDDTLGAFTLNKINGSFNTIPTVTRGDKPSGVPGHDITRAYYNGTAWVRYIDDTAA